MQVPLKHHYLPVFYLKRWAGSDQRLCEFSKPHREVKPRRVYPEQTGFVNRLYETKGLPPDQAQRLEQLFMQPIDSQAADALALLEGDPSRLTREPKLRSAWSRFIMSLLMRMPDDMTTLKRGLEEEWNRRLPEIEREYAKRRGSEDPLTIEEYLDQQRGPHDIEQWGMSLAPSLIDHRGIGELLNNMRWLVRRIDGDAQFLTSDRPVVMTASLGVEHAYLFLPIGPKAAFVAINDIETQRMVEARDPAEQIKAVNQRLTRNATKRVYACDDHPLEFVRRHMSAEPQPSLFERLVQRRRQSGDAS
jgi:uncharacterized protein DUF4238